MTKKQPHRMPGDAESVSTRRAFRHLLVFQLKLALDAVRDVALSPLSITLFVVDAIRKPPLEESLYLRMMALGRRSDRLINLFDEFSEADHYTVDQAVNTVEDVVKPHFEDAQRRRRQRLNDGER